MKLHLIGFMHPNDVYVLTLVRLQIAFRAPVYLELMDLDLIATLIANRTHAAIPHSQRDDACKKNQLKCSHGAIKLRNCAHH
jgi:hypothetical protein